MFASRVKPIKKQWAKAMRRKPTATEALLWAELRKQKRYKFTRQKLCLGYILDFYSAAVRVAVEVDGSSHDDRARYDENRDAILRDRAGIITLRFHNETVVSDTARVVASIVRLCESLPRKN